VTIEEDAKLSEMCGAVAARKWPQCWGCLEEVLSVNKVGLCTLCVRRRKRGKPLLSKQTERHWSDIPE
jgi:hypothetical protein